MAVPIVMNAAGFEVRPGQAHLTAGAGFSAAAAGNHLVVIVFAGRIFGGR